MEEIKCPYCKQLISPEAKICPYCTSKLQKKDISMVALIIGIIISIIWIIGNIGALTAFNVYPEILKITDKHGTPVFDELNYLSLCFQGLIYSSIAYIIPLVKKEKILQKIGCNFCKFSV